MVGNYLTDCETVVLSLLYGVSCVSFSAFILSHFNKFIQQNIKQLCVMKIHKEIYFTVSELSQIPYRNIIMSLRQYFKAVDIHIQVISKHEDVTFESTK